MQKFLDNYKANPFNLRLIGPKFCLKIVHNFAKIPS